MQHQLPDARDRAGCEQTDAPVGIECESVQLIRCVVADGPMRLWNAERIEQREGDSLLLLAPTFSPYPAICCHLRTSAIEVQIRAGQKAPIAAF